MPSLLPLRITHTQKKNPSSTARLVHLFLPLMIYQRKRVIATVKEHQPIVFILTAESIKAEIFVP